MLAAVPTPVTVRVPAKINLQLAVGARRPDGYHDLTTVFHAVSLYDEISVVEAPQLAVEVHGEGAGEVPADGGNLAWRAAELLAEHAGRAPDVSVVLRKGIPVAGGMAGGSADAAATLVALSALWKLDLSRDELSGLAAELGSDVSFALHGGTALGTGRGERIVPVLSRHTQHWVIALHRGGLSTPAVFGELDRLRGENRSGAPSAPRPVEPVIEAVAGGDPRQLALCLGNDLQAAAVSMAPDLRRTLRAGVDAGALAGLVSGSGPSCAFLCSSHESAVEVAADLAGMGVCRTVRVAQGPVPGARVVDPADPPSRPPFRPAPAPPLGHA